MTNRLATRTMQVSLLCHAHAQTLNNAHNYITSTLIIIWWSPIPSWVLMFDFIRGMLSLCRLWQLIPVSCCLVLPLQISLNLLFYCFLIPSISLPTTSSSTSCSPSSSLPGTIARPVSCRTAVNSVLGLN